MSKMKKHEFEAAIEEGIKNMNLSHRKELLPYIFESLDLKEYYEAFEAAGYPLPKDYKPLEPTPLQIKPLGDVKAMPRLVVIDSLSEISSRKQK